MLGKSLTDAGGSGGRKENAPPFRKAADISQFFAPRETSSQSNHHHWMLLQDIQLFINMYLEGLLQSPQLIEIVLFLEMKIIGKTGKGRGLV